MNYLDGIISAIEKLLPEIIRDSVWTIIDNILQVWPVGYECARGEKKANLRRFLGNLKVHLKTKSAPMADKLSG